MVKRIAAKYEDSDITALKDAVRIWGIDTQMDMLREELVELLYEIRKTRRGRLDLDGMAEEMADVYIMMTQIIEAYDLHDDIADNINKKMKRLKQRIEENSDNNGS